MSKRSARVYELASKLGRPKSDLVPQNFRTFEQGRQFFGGTNIDHAIAPPSWRQAEIHPAVDWISHWQNIPPNMRNPGPVVSMISRVNEGRSINGPYDHSRANLNGVAHDHASPPTGVRRMFTIPILNGCDQEGENVRDQGHDLAPVAASAHISPIGSGRQMFPMPILNGDDQVGENGRDEVHDIAPVAASGRISPIDNGGSMFAIHFLNGSDQEGQAGGREGADLVHGANSGHISSIRNGRSMFPIPILGVNQDGLDGHIMVNVNESGHEGQLPPDSTRLPNEIFREDRLELASAIVRGAFGAQGSRDRVDEGMIRAPFEPAGRDLARDIVRGNTRDQGHRVALDMQAEMRDEVFENPPNPRGNGAAQLAARSARAAREAPPVHVMRFRIQGKPTTVIEGKHVYHLKSTYHIPKGGFVLYYDCWCRDCNARCTLKPLDRLGRYEVLEVGKLKHLHPEKCCRQEWEKVAKNKEAYQKAREIVRRIPDCSIALKTLEMALKEGMLKGIPTVQVSMRTINRWKKEDRDGPIQQAESDIMGIINGFGRAKNWLRGAHLDDGVFDYIWFMTPGGMEHLKKCHIWLVDGTFWSCPKPFDQLYNIMGFDGQSFVPCAHFLLKGKREDVYEFAFKELLRALSKSESVCQVRRIITDYEAAEKEGFRKAIENLDQSVLRKLFRDRDPQDIRISGCLFHYNQAIQHYYNRKYRMVGETQKIAKKIMSFFMWLPYYDEATVKDLFSRLKMNEDQKLCARFIEYFERTWLKTMKMKWWRVQRDDTIVTNSAIEVFHKNLKKKCLTPPDLNTLQLNLLKLDQAKLWFNRWAHYDINHNMSKRRTLARQHRDLILQRLNAFVDDPYRRRIGVDYIKKTAAEMNGASMTVDLTEEGECGEGNQNCDVIYVDVLHEAMGSDLEA
jgi:hypothetical protein